MRAFATQREVGTLIIGPRHLAAAYAHRHENQVRRHCEPVACDVASRALLYDLEAVCAELATLARRVA